jgi:hypothetical protein
MIRKTRKTIMLFGQQTGWESFFKEMFISLLLGFGLGILINSIGWGLITGFAFGLASYFVQFID